MEFLKAIAHIFIQATENEKNTNGLDRFADYIFVFPSRRSAKFFIKYAGEEFAEKYNSPLLSPRTITISNLFTGLSGLREIDSIEASIILYQEYIALKKARLGETAGGGIPSIETYDEFSRWADIVISDFNDIDKYRIDYKDLFANIKDLKDLETDLSYLTQAQIEAMKRFWGNFHKGILLENNGGTGNRLDIKKEFTDVWGIMPALYENFRKNLLGQGKATSGMIYSEVAAMSEKESFSGKLNEALPAEHYVFIGFNAPNKCEEALFDTIAGLGKADFYWDFASPLLRCKDNKASLYINRMESKYHSRYPHYKELIGSDYEQCRRMDVIAVSGAVQQAAITSQILEQIKNERQDEEEAFDTAIVLPDENLLFPVLNSIPLSYKHINVSMGYPMSLTPLGSFMNLLKNLHLGTRQNSCYYKDICNILEHDYIKNSCTESISEIKSEISEKNMIFIRKERIGEWIGKFPEGNDGELLKGIFGASIENWTELAQWHMDVLRKLDSVSDKLTRNFIMQYYTAIERILSYESLDNISMMTFYKLEAQLTAKLTVPFEGEPLRGLQLVGPLEIRSLDFKNLIILNVNESVFPKSNTNNSFIPYNLRKGFGLPTYEQADAIAAYHFYRSIYRCKNIWFLYDTRTDGMKNGELSRFVKQLKYHYNLNLNEFTAQNPTLNSKEGAGIKVEKNAAVMERINRFRSSDKEDRKHMSASSIKTYLACPLKFYLNNIEGLEQDEEMDEDIAANTFGNLYHNSMQAVYEPYVGKQISEKDIVQLLKSLGTEGSDIRSRIELIFERNKLGEIKGRNVIVYKALLKYIELTLERDKSFTPFKYKYSEKMWTSQMNGVNLIAFIDRTDIVHGILRISDYKTGKVEDIARDDARNLAVRLFPAPGEEFKYNTWFQLYFYALIMLIEKQMDEDINLAAYQVAKLNEDGVRTLNVNRCEIEDFKTGLSETINSIFDPQIPFTQAPEGAKICSWCQFKSICKR